MTTWLAALRKKRCHPQLRVAIERSRPRAWLRPRATLGEVMRGSVIRGCARGSYRLQGVDRRRVALSRPAAKSLWITRTGLALLRESAGRAKERRKPNRRWQNREIGGGFPPNRKDRENGPSWEHLSIGRRSGSGKSLALTRERRKRSWFLTNVARVTGGLRGARQGASEVARQPGASVDNAEPRWRH